MIQLTLTDNEAAELKRILEDVTYDCGELEGSFEDAVDEASVSLRITVAEAVLEALKGAQGV